MITRNFNLYLNAGHSVPLVINVNQYDSGEQWVFTLYNADGTQYTPSTGAIVGIKSDGLGIINTGTVDGQGRVVINETQQMTAAVGKAVFELLIDSQTHGTANFVVLVEEKPGNNADLSESDLSLLQEAIDATSPLPTGGSVGQVLTKTANGSAWSDAGTPTQEQVADAVSDWADEHITVTTGVVIDTSLSVAGAAADAKKTGDEITDLKSAIAQGSGLTAEVKSALLALLQKVILTVDDGEQLFQNLYDAMYPPVELVSISAVYTQSGTVYDSATLDSLRTDLVVTATYDDHTTAVITDYVLSGTLEAGISTITATYSGKSATFTVTVTALPASLSYMWDYTQSLTDVVGNKETVVYNGAFIDDDGLHLDDINDYAVITGLLTPGTPQTVEIDVAEMTGENTNVQNRGFVYWGGAITGLVYRNNNTWCLYAKSHGKDYNQWSGSISADATYFNNCTLKLTFDSERVILAYKDGTYIMGNLDIGANDTSLQLGSATQNMYKITITGIRVYNEVI